MTLIEPTYLRYVYDGLGKGLLNAENAAALPYGFIGLYEEAFQSNTPITNRQSTLRQLAIWALFKGGVSTYLVSEILNIDEKSIKSIIDNFSSWFNTTDSNKYILYHDRLRTFLLQKLSSNELQELNEQIISHLEKALEAQKGDEAEIYALEHLSTHMAVESQMDSKYERLHDFANKESIWPRQVSVSKQYKWSQQTVQYSIKEGARRHHEMNTLTATVNSVKLLQNEQNSVQQILHLLNQGDYQTAFNRTQSFEGEKLFTIYLLLIHELTLGKSRNSHFKINACKAVLQAIDEQDDWFTPSFYPEIALFLYYLELKKIPELYFDTPKDYIDEDTGEIITEFSKHKFLKKGFLNQFHSIIEKDGNYIPDVICTSYLKNTINNQFYIGIKNYADFDFQQINPEQIYPTIQIIYNGKIFDEINGYIEIARNYFDLKQSESFKQFIDVKTDKQITNPKEAGLLSLNYALEKIINLDITNYDDPDKSEEQNFCEYLEGKTNYLITICSLLKLNGEKIQIIETIDKAIDLLTRIEEKPLGESNPKPEMYFKIFEILFDLNEISRCIQITEMIKMDFTQKAYNTSFKITCYTKLLNHLYENEMTDTYNDIFQKFNSFCIEIENVISPTFNKAIVDLNNSEISLKRKNIDEAFEKIKNINSISSGISFLEYSKIKTRIIDLLFKNYQTEKALEILHKYYGWLENLKKDLNNYKLSNLFSLSQICFKYFQNELGNKLFEKSIFLFNEIETYISEKEQIQRILSTTNRDFIKIGRIDLIYYIIENTNISKLNTRTNPIERICYDLLEFNYNDDAIKIAEEYNVELIDLSKKIENPYRSYPVINNLEIEKLILILQENEYQDKEFKKFVFNKLIDTNDFEKLKFLVLESFKTKPLKSPYYSNYNIIENENLSLRDVNTINEGIVTNLLKKIDKKNISACFNLIEKFEKTIIKNENQILLQNEYTETNRFLDNSDYFTNFISKIKIDVLLVNCNELGGQNKKVFEYIFDVVDNIKVLESDRKWKKDQKLAALKYIASKFRDKGFEKEAYDAIYKCLELHTNNYIRPSKTNIICTLITIHEKFNNKSLNEYINEIVEYSKNLKKIDESWIYIVFANLLAKNGRVIDALKMIELDLKKLLNTPNDDIFLPLDKESCFDHILIFLNQVLLLSNNDKLKSILIEPNYNEEKYEYQRISSEDYKRSMLKFCEKLLLEDYSFYKNNNQEIKAFNNWIKQYDDFKSGGGNVLNTKKNEPNEFNLEPLNELISEEKKKKINTIIQTDILNGGIGIFNNLLTDENNEIILNISNIHIEGINEYLKSLDHNEFKDLYNSSIKISNLNSEYIYFNKFSNEYKGLLNLLFLKGKMACFFDEDKKEEKLNLIEQVIDIKEWREISASL